MYDNYQAMLLWTLTQNNYDKCPLVNDNIIIYSPNHSKSSIVNQIDGTYKMTSHQEYKRSSLNRHHCDSTYLLLGWGDNHEFFKKF